MDILAAECFTRRRRRHTCVSVVSLGLHRTSQPPSRLEIPCSEYCVGSSLAVAALSLLTTEVSGCCENFGKMSKRRGLVRDP